MVEQNKYESPGWETRLGDLQSWHIVWGVCTFCGHRAQIPQEALWRKHNKHDFLRKIADKLKCTRCGKGGHNRFQIGKKPRN